MLRVRNRAATIVTGACLAAMLVGVPSAQAAVTKSAIATPADLTYLVYQHDSPNSLAVSGTSNGKSGTVDLDCFYGNTFRTMASSVAVHKDGSFTAGHVSLAKPPYTPCRLRAIPTGTTPSNLKPFTGPTHSRRLHSDIHPGQRPERGEALRLLFLLLAARRRLRLRVAQQLRRLRWLSLRAELQPEHDLVLVERRALRAHIGAPHPLGDPDRCRQRVPHVRRGHHQPQRPACRSSRTRTARTRRPATSSSTRPSPSSSATTTRIRPRP